MVDKFGVQFGPGRSGSKGKVEVNAMGASPLLVSVPFMAAGLYLLYQLIGIVASLRFNNLLGTLFEIFVVGVLGISFAGAGIAAAYTGLKLPRTVNSKNLAKLMGVSEEELSKLAEDRGVDVRYIVNGEDYYRAEDFDEASLLRSGVRIDSPSELLRAARTAQSTTPSSQLLRGSGPELEGQLRLPRSPAKLEYPVGQSQTEVNVHSQSQ